MKSFYLNNYGASELARAWIISTVMFSYVCLICYTKNDYYAVILIFLLLASRDKRRTTAEIEDDIDALKQKLIDRG